jgi:hypothetical protein
MGGALGLAVLASLAAARTDGLLAAGEALPAALTGGFQAAFLAGAVLAAVAAAVAGVLLRESRAVPAAEPEAPGGAATAVARPE